MGRAALLAGIVDPSLRKAALRYLVSLLRHPSRVLGGVGIQTLVVMQPQDILPSGEQDMCDGCPNKTYWRGRLVSMCRMDEYVTYGSMLTVVPKLGAAGTRATVGRTAAPGQAPGSTPAALIDRSWERESPISASTAPVRAMNMSPCASQTSPCEPSHSGPDWG